MARKKCIHIYEADWQGWRCRKCGKPKGKNIGYDLEYNRYIKKLLKARKK